MGGFNPRGQPNKDNTKRAVDKGLNSLHENNSVGFKGGRDDVQNVVV